MRDTKRSIPQYWSSKFVGVSTSTLSKSFPSKISSTIDTAKRPLKKKTVLPRSSKIKVWEEYYYAFCSVVADVRVSSNTYNFESKRKIGLKIKPLRCSSLFLLLQLVLSQKKLVLPTKLTFFFLENILPISTLFSKNEK